MTPKRIQLKRSRGWRLPQGAVIVDRRTRWGNPYVIGETLAGDVVVDAADAARRFKLLMQSMPGLVVHARRELAGKDLACWCPLPKPGQSDVCHAAYLIHIAAGGEP